VKGGECSPHILSNINVCLRASVKRGLSAAEVAFDLLLMVIRSSMSDDLFIHTLSNFSTLHPLSEVKVFCKFNLFCLHQ